MPISFTCECGKKLRVSDAYAGRKSKCPYCQRSLVIPPATVNADSKATGLAVVMPASPDTKVDAPPIPIAKPVVAKPVLAKPVVARPVVPPPVPAAAAGTGGENGTTRDVFLSYSTHDKTTADAICAALESQKVRCWIAPRDVLPGVPYGEAIIEGINTSRVMVVVLSTASNASQQVLREVERAVSKGIPIVPFRIEDVKPSKSMEYFLSAPHWLDALTKPLEMHIERLTTVVQAVLSPAHRPPAGPAPGGRPAAGASPRGRFRTGLRRFATLAGQKYTSLPRRLRRAGLGVVTVAVLAVVTAAFFRPHPLKAEYAEYQKNVVTGRGSVVFLQRLAPQRYTDWRGRAEAGDPIAQLFIGRCYQEGVVVAKDDRAAIPWFERSAAQGNDYAMVNLGVAHEKGYGVEVDRPKALQWYTRAADIGNANGMRGIGFLYQDGVSSKPEPELAFSWFRRAADAGHPLAMRDVGNCYRTGKGVAKDPAESDRWHQRAADAGDTFLIGKFFGNRLAPHYAAYLAADATEPQKSAAVAALRTLQAEYDRLDFATVSALFSASDLNSAQTGLLDLKPDDPLRAFHDALVQKYVELFGVASPSERVQNVSYFSAATEPLVDRWVKNRQYDDVAGFWEKAYKGLPLAEMNAADERDALVRQLSKSITSLMTTTKSKEAEDALAGALDLCDRALQVHPWDWYLKNAYTGLCFDTAATWMELGEPAKAQLVLRRGWGVYSKQYGKEALLTRYPELPLKGKVPANASNEDREFFERFGPNPDPKKGGMKRFTFPCDFGGKKYPFHVYVISGPRGYAELQDQFRWVNEKRGGGVPSEIRDSFLRLNRIAVENNVDFMELCVYALGTAAAEEKKEKP